MNRNLIIFFLAVCLCFVSESFALERTPGSLQELYQLEQLALPRTGTTCRMFSSYDRSGANDDGFAGTYSKLRVEDGNSVIAEMEGAGCIQRIWFTHSSIKISGLLNREQEHIRIYLDGSDRPEVDIPLEELFSGELPAFPSPLVGSGAGGFYCYIPIPYRDGCKVVVEGTGVRFYQITYNEFDDPGDMETFSMKMSEEYRRKLHHAVKVWSSPGDRDLLDISKSKTVSKKLKLDDQEVKEIKLPKGPWMVRSLELEVDEENQSKALDSWIQIFWDGSKSPAVDASARYLFVQGMDPDPYQSLLAGKNGQTFYLYTPMPYGERGVLTVQAKEAFVGKLTVVLEKREKDSAEFPYFHAEYFDMTPVESGLHYPILNTTGTGHVVGFQLASHGFQKSPLWLEGDEQFYCNNELLIHGTGTEDYFNCGWYEATGRLVEPGIYSLHGFTVFDQQEETADTAAYRWHLTDPVGYDGELLSQIEHGPDNSTPADYSSSVYFYDTRREKVAVEITLPTGNNAIFYLAKRMFQWGHGELESGVKMLPTLAECQERKLNRLLIQAAQVYLEGMQSKDPKLLEELTSFKPRLASAAEKGSPQQEEVITKGLESAQTLMDAMCIDLKRTIARAHGFESGDEIIIEARDPWGKLTPAPEYTDSPDYLNSYAKVEDVHLIGSGARFSVGAGVNSEARFTPDIPEEGFYEVQTIFSYGANSSDGKYIVRHADGVQMIPVEQRGRPGTTDRNNAVWIPLGTYRFEPGSHTDSGSVALIAGIGNATPPNEDISYRVYADSMRFVYRGKKLDEKSEVIGEPFLKADDDGLLEDFEGESGQRWTQPSGNLIKQPTKAYRQGINYGHQGEYLIATTETGGTLPSDYSDLRTGVVKSPPLVIEKSFISFLISGGNDPENLRMALVRESDGFILKSATGDDGEEMSRKYWDVSNLIGQVVHFEVQDHSPGDWGHLSVDDIRVHDTIPLDQGFPLVLGGKYRRIYNPGLGQTQGQGWYINDHCFVYGPEGEWHLFGITGTEPIRPSSEDNFAHATSPLLNRFPWKRLPYALTVKEDAPWLERHLWAPHVIEHEGTYYMYYCAGDADPSDYKISLATSTDLYNWERYSENPLFQDGSYARDPFILKVDDQWVMYYTATSEPEGGNHVVACRTSTDLLHWENRRIVFTDPSTGTGGGPTESPFVLRRGGSYYLFIGPRKGYAGTDIFRSDTPWHWGLEDLVGHVDTHAAEVVRDTDGKWYISHCGWRQGGVYLMPLYWNDGEDCNDTSLPIPGKK